MPGFDAIFEDGKLRPLEPTHLKEGGKVHVSIESTNTGKSALLDTELIEGCRAEADTSVTLEQVRSALSSISGSLTFEFEVKRDERQG